MGSRHICVLLRDSGSRDGNAIRNSSQARGQVCAQRVCSGFRDRTHYARGLWLDCTRAISEVSEPRYSGDLSERLHFSGRSRRNDRDLVSVEEFIEALLPNCFYNRNLALPVWVAFLLPIFYLGISKGTPLRSN